MYNAIALGAVLYNRVLPSRDAVGRSPLVSRKATMIESVLFPMLALDCICPQSVTMP